MKGKVKNIVPMIITAVIMTVVFALIGAGLCMWFNTAAKPTNIRVIRNAVEWTTRFALFYFAGCGVSLIYTIFMSFMGEYCGAYRSINWIINTVVTIFIGIALAIVFYIMTPSKYVPVSVVASIAIFLQGLLIFFVTSLFAPRSWGVYNLIKG